jgi:amidohydrolase
MENILKNIQDIKDEVIGIRRYLHRIPEPGFKEIKTSEYILSKLEEYGVNNVKRMAVTGVVANITPGIVKKTIMLRADMDGLPVREENDIDYRSKNEGWMHACGHDGHMAIMLGVINVLSRNVKRLKGNIKFVFQPSEENPPGGAIKMIQEGVLKNPGVNAAIGLHIWNNLPCGIVGIRKGPLMASVDQFKIKILGKAAHGAMPHLGVDPVVVASQVINALQIIISRELDPIDNAVLTIGKINGGSAYNIIADEVEMAGTVRVLKPGLNMIIREKIEKILKNVTSAMNAKYDLEYGDMYPVTINDKKITELVRRAAEKTVGKTKITEAEKTMGGEDMAFYLREVPGCYFFLGSSNNNKGINSPHHSSTFNFDEDCMIKGIEILIRTIIEYLGS